MIPADISSAPNVESMLLAFPALSVKLSKALKTSYSVKPKSIDFTGFDDFYLPLKQSRL